MEEFEIYYSLVEDPRNESYITYKLSEILFIVMCCALGGCKSYEEMEDFVELRIDFFRKHTSITNRPCQATFSNIMKQLNPERLELCFHGIWSTIFKENTGTTEQIAASLRAAHDEKLVWGVQAFLFL